MKKKLCFLFDFLVQLENSTNFSSAEKVALRESLLKVCFRLSFMKNEKGKHLFEASKQTYKPGVDFMKVERTAQIIEALSICALRLHHTITPVKSFSKVGRYALCRTHNFLKSTPVSNLAHAVLLLFKINKWICLIMNLLNLLNAFCKQDLGSISLTFFALCTLTLNFYASKKLLKSWA